MELFSNICSMSTVFCLASFINLSDIPLGCSCPEDSMENRERSLCGGNDTSSTGSLRLTATVFGPRFTSPTAGWLFGEPKVMVLGLMEVPRISTSCASRSRMCKRVISSKMAMKPCMGLRGGSSFTLKESRLFNFDTGGGAGAASGGIWRAGDRH